MRGQLREGSDSRHVLCARRQRCRQRLWAALAGGLGALACGSAWAQAQMTPEEMQVQQMQAIAEGAMALVLLIQGVIFLIMIIIPVAILLIARRNMQGWRQPVKYVWFSYSGRLNRKAYWLKGIILLSLVAFAVQFALVLLAVLITMPLSMNEGVATGVSTLFSLPLIVFQLWAGSAVAVKRAHDLGHSGWWLLTMLIPFWNIWVAIQLAFFRGTSGANDFGEDPLDSDGDYDDYIEQLKAGAADGGADGANGANGQDADDAPRAHPHPHAPQHAPHAPKGFGSRKFAPPQTPASPQAQAATEAEPAHPLATHADMDVIKKRLGNDILRPIGPNPKR